jgi:hypothetical protein
MLLGMQPRATADFRRLEQQVEAKWNRLKHRAILVLLLISRVAFGGRFLLPVLPDTQCEVSSSQAMFTSQLSWIAANKAASNVVFALHVGDIINWDTSDHQMWITASNGFRILDNAGIAYALALGNHDTAAVTNGGGAAPGSAHTNVRITTQFNTFFPTRRFSGQRGTYESGKSDNAWYVWDAGGVHWLVLSLEFCSRQTPVDWAKTVLATHTNYNAIILTHYHLDSGGTISASNAGYGDLSPQQIYDQLIYPYPNVRLVLSGHVDSSAWRNDPGVNGNRIYQILQDYQGEDNGGGYMRLLDIDTTARTISARMYSPYYNLTKADASRFSFTNVQFVTDGTVPAAPGDLRAAAASGSQINLSWADQAGNETGFKIERKTGAGGTFVPIATVVENATSFQDTGLSAATAYSYRVRASNSVGESAYSNEASTTTTDGTIPVPNFGFEIPTTSTYLYNPSGGTWTFSVHSGISANNSGFTSANPPAPQGTQVAFLQQTSSVAQVVGGFTPGTTYAVLYAAAQRKYGTAGQTWDVRLDGTGIGSVAPPLSATNYVTYAAGFTASATSHTLAFAATDLYGGDNTLFLDNIRIVPSSTSLPSPWRSADVGTVGAAGAATQTGGVFTLTGSGADIGGLADELHYVCRPANGDCDLRACVATLQNTHAAAKAGVMIRESTNANSPHALMAVTPASGAEFVRRAATGGPTTATTVAGTMAPQWVRLVRSGNTFTAYRSANGTAWTLVGADTILMATNVYVGLAVSSHADGTLCAAQFSDVSAPLWSASIRAAVSGGECRVAAPAAQGQSCVLEASSNLTSWQPLRTNTAANGNGVELTDGMTGRPQRFYRVKYP